MKLAKDKKLKKDSVFFLIAYFVFLGVIRAVLSQKAFIITTVAGSVIGGAVSFFITKQFKEEERSKKIAVINKIFMFLGLICLLGAVLEGFIYTFASSKSMPFWGIALIIGIGSGIFYIVKIQKDEKNKAGIFIGLFTAVAVFLIVSVYSSHLNYILDTSEPIQVEAEIWEKDVHRRSKGSDEYSFVVIVDGKHYKIKVSSTEYKKYNQGDMYGFYKYNGAFGEPFYLPG